MARLVDLVDAEVDQDLLPAWDGENAFTDVSPTSPHVAAINRLADAGIVRGGPGGRPASSFGPGLGVTRAQVAALLNRAFQTTAGGSFISSEVYFDDLAGVLDEHAQDINALAEEGIVVGRQIGDQRRYDPGSTVQRDQMATILMRDLSILYDLGVLGPPFTEPAPGSGAEPVVAGGFPSPSTPTAQLIDVRLARHETFDRFVLEFDGAVPSHAIRYVEPPVLRSGSGEPVVLPGNAYLAVDVAGASGFDMEAGVPTYDGPDRIPLDGNSVLVAERTGDFEALLNWRLGVDVQRPFTVRLLDFPTRIVVDVAAPCIGPPTPAPGEDQMVVTAFFGCEAGDDAQDVTAVAPAERVVPESPDVLGASLGALLAGPTDAERALGYRAFFSDATADMLLGATVDGDGAAVVDFDADLATTIPNASTSAGGAAFLSQLNATVFQFLEIESVEYRLAGSCDDFFEWLQSDCTVLTRTD